MIEFNKSLCVLIKELGHVFRQGIVWYKDIDCMLESCKLLYFSIMFLSVHNSYLFTWCPAT